MSWNDDCEPPAERLVTLETTAGFLAGAAGVAIGFVLAFRRWSR